MERDSAAGRIGRGDEERSRAGGGYGTQRGYGGGQSGYAAGYSGGGNTGYDEGNMGYGSLGSGADTSHGGSMGYGSSMGGDRQRERERGMSGWSPGQGQEQRSHRGKGPAGYTRSDERIHEDVCDVLTDDHHIDASGIQIAVKDGEVTLTGFVPDRRTKRMAEDRVAAMSGVKDVCNNLKVQTDAKP